MDTCGSGAIAYHVVLGVYALRATHGILMVIAFVLMSPLASVMARYLKKQLDGGRWFRYHRLLQVSAVFSWSNHIFSCQSTVPDGGACSCISHCAVYIW